MKKILVTGGCGYIGSHTVVELLKRDYEVVIIDNFSNSKKQICSRITEITKKNFFVYERDCRDNLDDIFSQHKIDAVIHFAALKSVSESVENPVEYYDNNTNSLLNIISYCKEYDVENIVFSSSCSLYGNLKQLPATEESEKSEPESPYAYTKLLGERILKDFSMVNKQKIICLRYFNPVGTDESGLIGESPINKPSNILPVICNSAETGEEMLIFGDDYNTKDGTCVRDYVHVSDIADAHIQSIEYLHKSSTKFDVYNLGYGDGVSVLEIVKAFERINNIKLNYKFVKRRPGDVEKIFSDSSKALNKLGWSPKRNIEDIVSSAWKWNKNKI